MSARPVTVALADRSMRDAIDAIGAHPDATPFVRWVVERLNHALNASASGTMRAWMEANNGATVTTLQVGLDRGDRWAPTGRTIDATRAGSVQLSGSTREYAGMRVLHATDRALIVADSWHVVAYVLETGAP